MGMLASGWAVRRSASLVRQVVQATEQSLPRRQQRNVWFDAPGEEERQGRDSFYDSTIEAYAQRSIEKLTLRQMVEFGQNAWLDQSKILDSAEFVREELPKRLARRLMDLQLLPYIVVTNPHIKRVYDCYFHAFNTLRNFPAVTTLAQNEHFSQVLRRLVDEHAPMLDSLASGLRECRTKPIVGDQLHLDAFLENMLRSRVSRRVLAEQHINLHNARAGYIGVIATELSIADSVDLAAGRCTQVCIETYGVAPDVLVSGDTGLTVPYIPAHLDYMLYELLKNAARAVVERHQQNSSSQGYGSGSNDGSSGRWGRDSPWHRLPPILVRICNSPQQITLRISDQGGGIPRDQEEKVWQYGFTTTETRESPLCSGCDAEGLGLDNRPVPIPSSLPVVGMEGAVGGRRWRMAGLGFGLPLSRLYARYFGGDLSLVNIAGYGVDAFLTLQRLDQHWQEGPADSGVEPLVSMDATPPVVRVV